MNDWFNSIARWTTSIGGELQNAFIEKDRWKYLVDGLGATLQITLFACLLGIVLGVVIAIVRTSHDKNIASMQKGLPRFLLKLFNKISKLYLAVIRGTPVVIQLMIMMFVIFASGDTNKVFVAVLTFGINSGAYVAEIIRSGIMSIDPGQFEAGRSLGFNYVQTMRYIILPQAFKNVLPALANEFIVLLKETSVAGYVAILDLTKAGHTIIGVTYKAIYPLLAVALTYLILVIFFTWLVGKLERRLQNSER